MARPPTSPPGTHGRHPAKKSVYLSGSGRDTTAEEEVGVYVEGVQATGAKAVKFKIAGRMSSNRDTYPGRTDKIFELAAKSLAGKVTLMADANGSYTADKGIEIGKRLEEMKYLWFEEPCPWEELGETKKVADALTMKVAFGEQNSSLAVQWMIDNKIGREPDLITAASPVPRMPHMAGANSGSAPQRRPARLRQHRPSPPPPPQHRPVSTSPCSRKKESWYSH